MLVNLDAGQSGSANLALSVWLCRSGPTIRATRLPLKRSLPEGITRTVITYAVIACNVKNYDGSTAYSAALRSAVSPETWSITVRSAVTSLSIISSVWRGPGVSRNRSVPRGTVG